MNLRQQIVLSCSYNYMCTADCFSIDLLHAQVSEDKELPGHFLSMSGGAASVPSTATLGRRHSTERQCELLAGMVVLSFVMYLHTPPRLLMLLSVASNVDSVV